MITHIKETIFTEKQFDRIKKEAVRKVANLRFEQPYRRVLSTWQQEMRPQLWPYKAIRDSLKLITLDDVNQVSEAFWKGAGLLALSSGAISEEQATATAHYMQKTLQKKRGSIKNLKFDITRLTAPSYKRVETSYEDYGYLYYWQAGTDTVGDQANWLLLGKLLETGYFHTLRTEQQLGYIVFANYYPLVSVPGIVFVVQSPKADVAAIHKSTLAFLDAAFHGLAKLSESTFKNYQSALIEQLSEKPKNLQAETAEYWGDLVYGFPFDRKEMLIDAIRHVDFSTWKKDLAKAYALMPERTLLMGTQPLSEMRDYQSIFQNDNAKKALYIYPRTGEK